MEAGKLIETNKMIVIVRGIYGEPLLRLSDALYRGGIRLMEVTFDQKDVGHLEKTAAAISLLRETYGEDMQFGAGTVLTTEQVKAAAQAGATYLISPNTNETVIHRTKELGLVSIPGAMTPTEILNAHQCGADFVKLFPAATLGLTYCKDIMAPINHVKMIATAGINEENLSDFFKLGFVGAGVSGRLTDKKLIAEQNWDELTRRAERFVHIASLSK